MVSHRKTAEIPFVPPSLLIHAADAQAVPALHISATTGEAVARSRPAQMRDILAPVAATVQPGTLARSLRTDTTWKAVTVVHDEHGTVATFEQHFTQPVIIELLSEPIVRSNDRTIVVTGDVTTQKPWQCLLLIAAHSPLGVSRRDLARMLWPWMSGPSLADTLYKTISRLRKLYTDLFGHDTPILVDGQNLQINPEEIAVDIHELTRRLTHFHRNAMSTSDDEFVKASGGSIVDDLMHVRSGAAIDFDDHPHEALHRQRSLTISSMRTEFHALSSAVLSSPMTGQDLVIALRLHWFLIHRTDGLDLLEGYMRALSESVFFTRLREIYEELYLPHVPDGIAIPWDELQS